MKGFILILTQTLLISISQAQTNINPFSGTERSGAVSFTINDTVYIGLGKNGDTHFNDFWRYSNNSNQWEQIADFPGEARAYAEAFSLNNKGYVGLGKYNARGTVDTTYPDFYSYNPSLNQWTKLNDFGGGARNNAVNFTINNVAYIGTGLNKDGNALKDFWKYNSTTDTWSLLSSVFSGDIRHSASAFTINGKAYVTGGHYFQMYSVQLSDVQEYDPDTDSWTERVYADGINLSINDATAFSFNGKGYICYGNKEDIVSYDPVTNEIENLGNILHLEDSRADAVSFILNGAAYLGLGFYVHDDGSTFGVDSYSNNINKIKLPNDIAPSDITLSNSSIIENKPNNTFVGLLSSVDANVGATHTYELVDNSSYPDNSFFSITDDSLFANTLDYESNTSLEIKIRSTNNFSNSVEKVLTITVVDDVSDNNVPTNISLSSTDIQENQPDSTLVGELTCQDDFSDTHTYELVDSEKYLDNSFFIIDNDKLLAKTLDFETHTSFRIKIRSINHLQGFIDKIFTITVINDGADIFPEATPMSNLVAYYAFDSVIVYNELDSNLNGTSYGSNYMESGGISKGSHTFATDDSYIDLFNFEPESFTINLWFNTTDTTKIQRIFHKGERGGNSSQLWSYSLLYSHNVFRFSIGDYSGIGAANVYSKIKAKENTWYMITCTFNHTTRQTKLYVNSEVQDSVIATNEVIPLNDVLKLSHYPYTSTQAIEGSIDELSLWSDALKQEKINFLLDSIPLTRLFVSPTDIELSNNSIIENSTNNSLVGTLSSICDKDNLKYTYEIIDDENYPDNILFSIDGSDLLANTLDFETDNELSILIRSTNNYNNSFEKEFTISVIDDLSDNSSIPSDIALSNNTILENKPNNTVVGTLSSTDDSNSTTHEYELVDIENYPDNSNFSISGSDLLANTLDYETTSNVTIKVRTTNNFDNSYDKVFTINVIDDENDNSSSISMDEEDLEGVTIHPNPVKDFLKIENSGSLIIKEIVLYTSNGTKIMSKESTTRLNLSNLSPAIYLLQIKTDKESAVYRIVVQ